MRRMNGWEHDNPPTPQKFRVTITEILRRTVEVEAADQQQAEQIVSDEWHNSKHILDAEDFADVVFDAVSVVDTLG